MNRDHEHWESTPYKSDPPAIDEVAAEEQRALRTASILSVVIFWLFAAALGVALGATAVWAILRAKHL
jgi:hypothetical protein